MIGQLCAPPIELLGQGASARHAEVKMLIHVRRVGGAPEWHVDFRKSLFQNDIYKKASLA